MKIAVISDIHGNIAALEAVAIDIRSRQAEVVLNLGDHVSGPLWPKETMDYLKRQGWLHIAGDHDRRLIDGCPEDLGPSDRYAKQMLDDEDLNWLRTLPIIAELPDGISFCHGSPRENSEYLLETVENGKAGPATHNEIKERLGRTDSSLVLCGHSHIPRTVEMPDNQLIVNPGSVGLPAYVEVEPEPHIMENGSPHARYAILEMTGDGWIVELIAISYDHHEAADQARKNGRLDWEAGLRTGCMKESP
jgi:predicted phosphodiesterase